MWCKLWRAPLALQRFHIIAAILDGEPINVGELIVNNIYMFASGSKKVVPHLSIICWLCEEAECDHFANDLSAPMMKPLNDTYMDTFVKDYHERLHNIQVEEAAADQPQPQHQPPPQQQQFAQGAVTRVPMHLFTLCRWTT